jgi:hypothetical protein
MDGRLDDGKSVKSGISRAMSIKTRGNSVVSYQGNGTKSSV